METNFLDLHQRPFDSAAQGLCGSLRTILFQIPESVKEKAQEIRLRANRPVAVYTGKETYFVKEQGRLTQRFDRTLPIVSSQEILDSFHHCCSYSVYSQMCIRDSFRPCKNWFYMTGKRKGKKFKSALSIFMGQTHWR